MKLITLIALRLYSWAFPSSALEAFLLLLERARMSYISARGFAPVRPIANSIFDYDYAVKHTSMRFEVRYAIRPMDVRNDADEGGGKSGQHDGEGIPPIDMHTTTMQEIASKVGGGIMPSITVFHTDAVRKEFNADWGATAFVDVDKEFGQDYKYCMLVSLHKSDIADVHVFLLADTKEMYDQLFMSVFYCIRFK